MQKGDTLTFTAWARLTGGWATPAVVQPLLSRVQPFLLLGAAATTDDPPGQQEDGTWTRGSANPGRNLLGRLAAGLSFTLGRAHSRQQLPAGTQSATSSTDNAWVQYLVRDANGNQVDLKKVLLPDGSTTAWQQLQVGVRVQQGGTVEVSVGAATTASSYVFFDDLTVEQTGGLIVQEQHQYAFGAPLPGLSYVVGNRRYRYGHQGQYAEHDDETGFESFELRLYNSRVGRWLSDDPYGQFSSPYVGMGNNPVSGVDPNGGFSGPGPGFWGNAGTRFRTLRGGVRASRTLAASSTAVRAFATVQRFSETNHLIAAHGRVYSTPMSFSREWAKGNWFSWVMSYDAVNSVYLAPQVFNANPRNFDGTPASLRARSFATFGILSMAIGNEESAVISEGEDIALGLGEHLDNFVQTLSSKEGVSATTYHKWAPVNFENSFRAKILNQNIRIHFNLDGMIRLDKSLADGARGLKYASFTDWEFYQILTTPGVLARTTFYKGGKAVLKPR